MNKQHALEHLRVAKASHVAWTQRAKMLIKGVDIDKNSIPVSSTECAFGRWFYHDGQKLNGLSNNPMECMTEIEQLHFQLHDVYLNIFNIFYNKPKQGFFSKLFGEKREVSSHEREMAAKYYEELESVSHKLLDQLNRLERRVIALPDQKIDALL